MQSIYSANQASYLYSSPVKSDPDTETDETETFIPKGKENIPYNVDQSHSKLKSSLCKNYAIQGFCPYGKKCQFAHGPQ